MLWLWHSLYIVGPHPVSRLHIYTFVVSRAFMAGAASQAGDPDSSWAPGLTSGLQRSVNVHRGALLLVPQWQYISSFVFYWYVYQVIFPRSHFRGFEKEIRRWRGRSRYNDASHVTLTRHQHWSEQNLVLWLKAAFEQRVEKDFHVIDWRVQTDQIWWQGKMKCT